jgi:hypothetical protein
MSSASAASERSGSTGIIRKNQVVGQLKNSEELNISNSTFNQSDRAASTRSTAAGTVNGFIKTSADRQDLTATM